MPTGLELALWAFSGVVRVSVASLWGSFLCSPLRSLLLRLGVLPPRRFEDFTAATLVASAGLSGVVPDVTGMTWTRNTSGGTSTIYDIRLHRVSGPPIPIIVKGPTSGAVIRVATIALDVLNKERLAFRFLDDRRHLWEREADMAIPRMFHSVPSAFDTEGLIVMQHMATLIPGAEPLNVEPIDNEELVSTALRSLARFHAALWDRNYRSSLPEYAPILQDCLPNGFALMRLNARNFLPMAKKYVPYLVDDEITELFQLTVEHHDRLADYLRRFPWTIVLNDFRSQNLFWRRSDGPGVQLGYVDLQAMTEFVSAFDVSSIMSCLAPDLVVHKDRLLRLYHDTLLDCGVGNLSYDDFQTCYRLSLVIHELVTIILISPAIGTEKVPCADRGVWLVRNVLSVVKSESCLALVKDILGKAS